MTLPRPVIIFLVLVFQIWLPLNLIVNVYTIQAQSMLDYFLRTVLWGVVLLVLLLANPWEYTNPYLRSAYTGGFLLGFAAQTIRLPFLPVVNALSPLLLGWRLILFIFWAIVLWLMLTSRSSRHAPFVLTFPLHNGTFFITEGGDGMLNFLSNSHLGFFPGKRTPIQTAMRYAVDIIQVNLNEFNMRGYLSENVQDYIIFDQPVYSPCDGMVTQVVDGIPDNIPYRGKYPSGTGNMVVIGKGDYRVVLGQLKQGSIGVKEGEEVTTGQQLGHVGNSGWSSRPHLHLHVSLTSSSGEVEGVPIFVDGRFPVKNDHFEV
jgi:hypothetical protein